MRIGKPKQLRENPSPVLLGVPRSSHEVKRNRTQSSPVSSQRPTSWAMARAQFGSRQTIGHWSGPYCRTGARKAPHLKRLLPVCLSIHPPFHPPTYLSTYLPTYPPIHPPIYLAVYLSIYLYVRHADHVAQSNSQKLALTSPISGGSSLDIVRSRTEATEFS
jgi:hypothetical protein